MQQFRFLPIRKHVPRHVLKIKINRVHTNRSFSIINSPLADATCLQQNRTVSIAFKHWIYRNKKSSIISPHHTRYYCHSGTPRRNVLHNLFIVIYWNWVDRDWCGGLHVISFFRFIYWSFWWRFAIAWCSGKPNDVSCAFADDANINAIWLLNIIPRWVLYTNYGGWII